MVEKRKSIYQEFIERKNENSFVVTNGLYHIYDPNFLKKLSSKEIKNLLFDEVWGNYFIQLFIKDINLFLVIFSYEEAFKIIEKLGDPIFDFKFVSKILKSKNAYHLLDKIGKDPRYLSAVAQNSESILKRNWNHFKKDKDKFQEICNNQLLYAIPLSDFTKENICELFKNLGVIKNYNTFRQFVLSHSKKSQYLIDSEEELNLLFDEFFQNKNIEQLFFENTQELMESIYNEKAFFTMVKYLKTKKNEWISKELITKELIISRMFNFLQVSNYENSDYSSIYDLLVKEILELSNRVIYDVEFLGSGSYNTCYKIGDYIIKTGFVKRKNDIIPNHPRILQPLLRRTIDEGNFVEISQYVQPLEETKENDSVVYNIYKELREDGIDWLDPKIDNIGILIRENIPYLKEEVYIDNETTGLLGKNEIILPIGEAVIFDTDYLQYYTQEMETIFSKSGPYYERYRKRYEAENNKVK